MKKLLAILLILAMALTFAACSGSEKSDANGSAADTGAATVPETEQESADVLSFLSKDEIYFDIHLTDGLFDKTSVKVGDQVLTASGKAKYTGDEDIVFAGTSDKDDDVYLVIISLRAGERATSDYSVVEASMLSEMLAQRIPIHKTNKDKILVIVTDTKDGYDHSFDSALSDLIKAALG